MKSDKLKKKVSIIYLIFCAAILILFYSITIRPQQEISIEENRTLQKIPDFTFKDFFNGNFQDEMENAVSDQLLFSIQIKYAVKQFYNNLTNTFSNIDSKINQTKKESIENINLKEEIALVKNISEEEDKLIEKGESEIENLNEINKESEVTQSIDENDFIQSDKNCYVYKEVVAGKLYKLDDSGYIVEKAHAPEEYEFELYDPQMLANVTFPKYLFFIESSESADFNDLKKYNTFEYIKNKMPMTGYDRLFYKSFDEYKTLFFQTDHHWNHHGSYIGYTKIMKMLEGEDVELLQPVRTHVYNTIYNGSLARDNLLKCSTEKFTVYEYNLPSYKTFVNDEEKEYGYRSYYVSDEDFPRKTYANHYGMYYGDDWAKVVYDFNQEDKENLLILGTSFTNSVNELIASHYNKTHVLDFRHYKKQYGERIDAQKYMEDNDISKMVIIGNISSLGYRINK